MAVSLLSRAGMGLGRGGMVITRFKVKTQFKLDLTGTELSLAKVQRQSNNQPIKVHFFLIF